MIRNFNIFVFVLQFLNCVYIYVNLPPITPNYIYLASVGLETQPHPHLGELICILRSILQVMCILWIYISIPRLGVTSSWPSSIQIIPSFISRSPRYISNRRNRNLNPRVFGVTLWGLNVHDLQ